MDLTIIEKLKKLEQLLGNNGVCIGKETLTVGASVVGLASIPANATYALMVLESNAAIAGAAIRYWESGDSPTTSDGIPRIDGSAWDISSSTNLGQFRAIRGQVGTHKIFIEYFKL